MARRAPQLSRGVVFAVLLWAVTFIPTCMVFWREIKLTRRALYEVGKKRGDLQWELDNLTGDPRG